MSRRYTLETAARIRQRIVDLEVVDPSGNPDCIALFKGQSVEAYAKEAGISINTARWYVKQIYAKTGVKRQTELVRVLLKTTARI